MVDQLFGSKTRVKLLRLFLGNPNRAFYVREITRKIDEQINSVRRELSNLLSIGIIVSDTNDNKLYYEINQSYEFFEPLSQIFGAKPVGVKTKRTSAKATTSKTTDESEQIKQLGNVEVAIYTGQFTRDERSGIDVLIVGDVNQVKVHNFIGELESKENKDIRYTVLSAADFNYRKQINDRFVTTVLESKKQVLLDKHGVL